MAWIDLETAGLHSTDLILEVGITITDRHGSEVASFHRVVGYAGNDWHALIAPGAFEMHSQNGLLDDVSAASAHVQELQECSNHTRLGAEMDALAFLDKYFTPYAPGRGRAIKIPMAGASVQFDRAVLKEQMPILHDWFHYRQYDVSTLLAMARMMGVEPDFEQKKLHRSIPDVQDEIAVHSWVMNNFVHRPAELPF